jgi:hypothetical protein
MTWIKAIINSKNSLVLQFYVESLPIAENPAFSKSKSAALVAKFGEPFVGLEVPKSIH